MYLKFALVNMVYFCASDVILTKSCHFITVWYNFIINLNFNAVVFIKLVANLSNVTRAHRKVPFNPD